MSDEWLMGSGELLVVSGIPFVLYGIKSYSMLRTHLTKLYT